MLAFVRAAFAAALVLLLSVPSIAADRSFKRDDLADAAIKLEAQIKAEAGQVTKPAAALRREADAAFQRNDFRSGMQILGQIVAVAPDDSANWLRLAKTVLQIRPSNDREKTLLLERAAILPIGQALTGCAPCGVEARAKTPVSFLWTASLISASAVHDFPRIDWRRLDTGAGGWQERLNSQFWFSKRLHSDRP